MYCTDVIKIELKRMAFIHTLNKVEISKNVHTKFSCMKARLVVHVE